jgi:hypothetical protein
MPNQNTRGLQMYCQSYQQNLVRTSNRQALLEYSRNRTQRRQLQRGAKLLNPTSATGVLLCKKPGPATNNHCQNGSNTLSNAIHNAAKGTSSTWRNRGSANNRAERKQLQRGAKLLNPTSATRVLLCKRPGPATKIAAKIIQTRCPIHSATQQRGQH